jgi:hypothetical protein
MPISLEWCCQKKNKVYTEPVQVSQEKPLTQKEFTEMFFGEVLSCGICKKAFSLRQHEVVAYCGGCYKFLHCGIAGKCVGPNCSFTIKGEQYRQTWCQNCVPKNFIINLQKIGSPECDCLCQECADDPNTNHKFKLMI